MAPSPVDPLLAALRDSGQLSTETIVIVEKAFAECSGNLQQLAERLNSAGALTRYQYRKIQSGRPADLLFGQYLILDKIGEGGMGKVYRAVQLRLHRLVALKVVRPQLMANKTVVKRYEREAAAAAKLDHPNIVKLFDAELTEGRYFLAMEYVEGLDLARLVKQFGPLPYQEAAEYIRQAALGLQHAHQASLIHRDIKPSNLLVYGERALPGTNGKASLKILDMGLVRSTLDDEAGQPDLTRDGTVVGTPDYMSPEQAKNSSQVTPQADIYSLGCTLYYLITGKPPYQDGSPVEKLIKHQLDPFPDVRKLVPGVPAGLARVLADMTAKRLSERLQSADMVALAIAPYTPSGDKFDLFSTSGSSSSGPQSGSPRTARYESVDLSPQKTVQSPIVAVVASAVSLTPPATPTVGSTAGPSTVRAARPKAIPIPEPEPVSAEIVSTGPSRKTSRPASVGTTRTRRTTTRVVKTKPFPVKLVVGCVLAAVAAVGLVVLVFHRPAPTPAPPVDPPKQVDPPKPVPQESPFRPVEELLPDRPTAVIVSHPKDYFTQLSQEAKPSGPINRVLDRLHYRYLFDIRKLDRLTVSFTSEPKGYVAVGEGGFLKPEWLEDLPNHEKTLKATPGNPGTYRLKFLSLNQPKNSKKVNYDLEPQGLILTGQHPAFFVSDRDDVLSRIDRRLAERPAHRMPVLESPVVLIKEVQALAERKPLFAFAASGEYRLPVKTLWDKSESLASLGVSLLTAEIRFKEKFLIQITVTGDSLEKLNDFLNLELPRRLNNWSDSLKPLAKAVVAEAPQLVTDFGKPRLTLNVHLEWSTFQTILGSQLSAPAVNKDK